MVLHIPYIYVYCITQSSSAGVCPVVMELLIKLLTIKFSISTALLINYPIYQFPTQSIGEERKKHINIDLKEHTGMNFHKFS